MDRIKKSAPQHAAEIIQQRIRAGVYPAGHPLPGQRQLAEELGVGRPAVREAISALEGLGLLRVEAGRGVFVSEPDAPGGRWRFASRYPLDDVYAVRAALESLSVRLVTQLATPAKLKSLDRLVDQLEAAVGRDDLLAMSGADREFHRQLAAFSENALLQEMLDAFDAVLTESRNIAFQDANRSNRAAPVAEHRQILAAIKAGDANAASRSMRKHIAQARTRSCLVREPEQETKDARR